MHCYHNSHSNTTTNNNNNTNKPIPHLRHRTTTSTEQQHAIHWRKKICEWSYQVADHFDLSRDIVYVAMNYVDRYCSGGTKEDAADDDENVAVNLLLQDKNRYQLLAMASLCLAIKLYGEIEFDPQEQEQQHDQYHHHHHHHQDSTTTCTSLSAVNHVDEILPTPDENGIVMVPPELRRTGDAKPSPEDDVDEAKRRTEASVSVSASVESWIVETILRLGRNYFTQEQLQSMELEVLANLGWYLHPPTPQLVLEYYFHEFCHHPPGCAAAAAAPNHNNLEELALFLIELSVHDYYFVATTPSIIALAALLNAAQLLIIQQQDNDDDDEEEEDGHHNPFRNTNINNDAGNVELSMSWITNVQHYLLLYNNIDTDDDGKCNTVATAATTATKEEEISSCRMRLHQLYTNTNATMDDFGATTQHHQPYTDRAGDGENNNGDDLVECNREPSPTSVTHDVK